MNHIQYVTEYEYATFALLSVLMGMYLTRRRLRTSTNSLFFVLMIFTFISSSLHMVTTKTLGHAQDYSRLFNYAVNIGYLLSYNLISVVYLVYVTSLTQKNHISRFSKIYASALFLFDLILLVSTPFNELTIYFDDNMIYRHGAFFYALPVLALTVPVYSISLFIRYRKQLKFNQSATIVIFVVFTVSAAVVQLVRPHQIIGNFFIALTLIVMFVSLENPADYVDKATDCLNREAFRITLGNDIEQKKSFTVIAFRSDGLDLFTEYLGNDGKNQVSAEIAKNIRTGLKIKELFYIDDWTFSVIVRRNAKMTPEEIIKVIESYFGAPIKMNGSETTATPYICKLSYPDFVTSAEDITDTVKYSFILMKKENTFYYEAAPEILDMKKRETHILATIKQFIENNGFDVYYQPIYDVKKEKFISAEALIRMKDPEYGFISPEEFIPLAEAKGFISDIGELVFRSVCKFLSSGRAAELGVEYIEVNLSPLQCVQEKLAENFYEIMKEYGVPSGMINFEITETAGLVNYDALIRNMDMLIKGGSTFSVDDYGTGFSTANYLITLPADIVKIDKSIVWSAMENEDAFWILKQIVTLIKGLRKEIVAEGAESAEMVKTLSDIGCDYIQGYYFSKPVTADEYIAFLEKSKNTVQNGT